MLLFRSLLTAIAVLSAWPLAVNADTIALIGTGDVSKTFGPRFAALGHRVVFGSRSPDRAEVKAMVAASGPDATAKVPSEAAAEADIVIVAVPWEVADEVVLGLGDLSGKILIDPINPRIVADDGLRDFASHTSSAERLQNLVPGAFVVKAFNTISIDGMTDPDVVGHPFTIPIAGNDAMAKRKVADLIEALGYEAVDVGPVRYAHVIEGLYLLRANSRDILGTHFDYHFFRRAVATPQAVR
jgi:predicted dinucleotide-binding enzyme